MSRFAERISFLLLLILGLTPRLLFIAHFPTIPVSDFNSLVVFGRAIHDHGLVIDGWFWDFFNPGLPLILSMLFRILPGDPGSVARVATAVACGLLPLLPFFIWRRVLPLWVRVLAGGLLAVWPGQIVFSGVVAQDNWVMLPTVALAALAVRTRFPEERAHPVIAGLLMAACVATRPEMLVVVVPLFFAASMKWPVTMRQAGIAAVAVMAPLILLAVYRGEATGHFALSTEHGGVSILGSYVPGSTVNAWSDPYPFIASVRPELLRDRKTLLAQSTSLAVHEALRRPGFQVARIVWMVWHYGLTGEGASLYWSLRGEALPPRLRAEGADTAQSLEKPLRYEMALIQGLFLAALLIAVRRRSVPIFVLAAAVVLKYLIHALIVVQGRYFYPATALELLALALAAYEVWKVVPADRLRLAGPTVGIGILCALGLLYFRLNLTNYVHAHDVDEQRTFQFPLADQEHDAELSCVVNRGVLTQLDLPRESVQTAAIRTFDIDPTPGEAGVAACELSGSGTPRPLTLRVLDPYAPGGLADRMLQRVEVDGVEVYSHDVAQDPGSGWARIPLGDVGAGTNRKVVIEVRALHPERGPGWGSAAVTTFQLWR